MHLGMMLATTSGKSLLRSNRFLFVKIRFRGVSFTRHLFFISHAKEIIMANPIWKDYYVSLGSADSTEYRIICNNEVIYSGKAWKRPGHSTNDIRINDICADYLNNVLPTMSQAEFSTMDLPVTFHVQVLSSETWTHIASVQFLNNWSYDYAYTESMGMAFPINHRISRSQWAIWTGLNVSQVEALITFKDGSSSSVFIPVALSVDFNADFNSDFARSVRSAATGTAVFRPSAWTDVAHITINGVRYDVVDDCSRYALYYLNAYGGWDSLLIEGNHMEVDNISRHTREVEYDNRNISNRGQKNYVNEISKALTLHTSWMSDDESSRMHHLLNSTEVYLYDIFKDQMIPVLIDNGTTDYKTFKSNGGKLVNYTIEVSFANDRIRR